MCAVLVISFKEECGGLGMGAKSFTKMLPGLRSISYKEWLDKLTVFLLKHQGELIVYKIMLSIDQLNSQSFSQILKALLLCCAIPGTSLTPLLFHNTL